MLRYLTKTRFAIGCECETKLFYTGKRNEYADNSLDDPFMQGLAEGGFQVGELARIRLCNDPAADIIRTLNHGDALRETAKHMKADEVTIAEAAFSVDNLFVRVDVLHKKGRTLKLYEVKSKSWDPGDVFWQKRDPSKPDSLWVSYLLDVAFQKYVVSRACPDMNVQAFLVLVNKNSRATVDGMNQLFKVGRRDGRPEIHAAGVTRAQLGADILECIDVDTDVRKVWDLKFPAGVGSAELGFEELIRRLAGIYERGERAYSGIGSKCRGCVFTWSKDPAEQRDQCSRGLKSGREECWREALKERFDPEKPTVLEVWNFRKADEMIQEKKYYLSDLVQADLGDGKQAQRQWLQVKKVKEGDLEPWIRCNELAVEMKKWKFPLHFIDFETSRVAIPFNRERRPYEQIAFQFSHHTVDGDGSIRHAGQWIELTTGKFPNFDFVRALKQELGKDDGSVFCYAPHENTVLNDIYEQLQASLEPDRYDLCTWIRTISWIKDVRGPRCLVDMRELILRHHYDPHTRGSNSLKAVLPAIIHSSPFLREKYGRAVYGTLEMPSLNFKKWSWIQPEQRNDPYKTLPPLFTPEEQDGLSEFLANLDEIVEGGEAMMAYAKLQFTEIPAVERDRIAKGLLRYCELDTLAMVMLYEYWKHECRV